MEIKTKRAYICSVFLTLISVFLLAEAEGEVYTMQREKMVRSHIEARGVTDEKVLEAMINVERHLFVPPLLRRRAYADSPLPIGAGQTISQPYIVAYMTEALGVEADSKVLEIGTGSAYQAAILAEIVEKVYTIEIIEELALTAEKRLRDLGYDNVEVKWGDGYKGWPEKAPFDAIMVTAAPPRIPVELVRQLRIGGRMIVPVGEFFQQLQVITKTEEGYDVENLIPVRFVPMVSREGT